jgi:hypothetical protein
MMIGVRNRCRRKHLKRQNAHATEGMTTKHLKILTPAAAGLLILHQPALPWAAPVVKG